MYDRDLRKIRRISCQNQKILEACHSWGPRRMAILKWSLGKNMKVYLCPRKVKPIEIGYRCKKFKLPLPPPKIFTCKLHKFSDGI
jgi:hypothetical protein